MGRRYLTRASMVGALLAALACEFYSAPRPLEGPVPLEDVVCRSCQGSDREECRQDMHDLEEAWTSAAQSLGLIFDEDCHKQWLEAVAWTSSESRTDWTLDCADYCAVFHGTGQPGEPCEKLGRRMSTCAAGLACGVDGLCTEPCSAPEAVPLGRPCTYSAGVVEPCETGAACGADGVCVPGQRVGDACGASQPCAVGARCVSGLCEAEKLEGEGCSAQAECASKSCVLGECVASVANLCPITTW